MGFNTGFIRCNAWTRRGTRCLMRSHHKDGKGGGRCRFHGGMSSGPKSAEGKARSLAAAKAGRERYWQRWNDAGRPRLPWHKRVPRATPRPPTHAEYVPMTDAEWLKAIGVVK